MTICDMHSLHLCRAIAVRNSGRRCRGITMVPLSNQLPRSRKYLAFLRPTPAAENPVLNEIAGNSIRPNGLTTTLAKSAPVYNSLILFLREFFSRCKNCTLSEDYLAVRPF